MTNKLVKIINCSLVLFVVNQGVKNVKDDMRQEMPFKWIINNINEVKRLSGVALHKDRQNDNKIIFEFTQQVNFLNYYPLPSIL